eukprot:1136823-Pelagomonas_calceolata.AAC.9
MAVPMMARHGCAGMDIMPFYSAQLHKMDIMSYYDAQINKMDVMPFHDGRAHYAIVPGMDTMPFNDAQLDKMDIIPFTMGIHIAPSRWT